VSIDVAAITRRRIADADAIRAAWGARRRAPREVLTRGRILLVAADHPARGALGVRDTPMAMASRPDLLQRLAIAVTRPGVDGVLATPDVLEDLLLAGLLDGKVLFGSMNRGGIQGAVFELDDRFTAYDVSTLTELGLDGGKMLTRIDLADPATARTLAACGAAVTALARAGRFALVEPFLTTRRSPDRVENLLDLESVLRSVAIATGLGATSSHTWLKLPVVDDIDRVLDATTLPTLLLGGDSSGDPDDTYAAWGRALRHPVAIGLVVGRALLHPQDDDVAGAVDRAAALVHADPHGAVS
jgi:hypothetical protein